MYLHKKNKKVKVKPQITLTNTIYCYKILNCIIMERYTHIHACLSYHNSPKKASPSCKRVVFPIIDATIRMVNF